MPNSLIPLSKCILTPSYVWLSSLAVWLGKNLLAQSHANKNWGGIGVIDIGSNGIRFGLVSSLTRHLPVVYEERAPISLFEAQHSGSKSDERTNIPEEVIVDVENSLKRFKYIAHHYQIDCNNVHVIATEATRTAPNSSHFIERIKNSTGWKIELLSKEIEAKISGMGVVATYYGVEGLVMDMGGGSVELNYVKHRPQETDQEISMSKDPINLPYGAAALTKLLEKHDTPEKRDTLFKQIVKDLKEGFEKLNAPTDIKSKDGSFTIYMNGGGFKSLGYLSMSETEVANKSTNGKSSYPISIINGYSTSAEELAKIVKRIAPSHDVNIVESAEVGDLFPMGNPFRISKRRAKLLPASAFLFEAILEVCKVQYVYFCEGGVRHGYCFNKLQKSIWSVDPLESFIKSHSLQPKYLTKAHHNQLLANVKKAIPSVAYDILDSDIPPETSSKMPKRLERLLPNLIYLAYWSMHFAKEARPITAFQLSLTGGPLANAPGLTHTDRAIIAWCLMYRYHEDGSGSKSGGVEKDISIMAPGIFDSVKKLIPGGKDGRTICEIVGKLIGFAILCYPVDVSDKLGISNISSIFKSGSKTIEKQSTIFELSEEGHEININDTEITKKSKKNYKIFLNLMDESVYDQAKVSLINNSLVKKSSEKLEKKYTLRGKRKKEKGRAAMVATNIDETTTSEKDNSVEIDIQVKRNLSKAVKEKKIKS
ncbi:Ppx/GppA phosphatase family-domain-containing protein [Glomus cerebriforme]|uniref:Ppx/GppA phosphatase family-domain-containing protein n=1 Tax=Glomus cerebriforme TaxID=658196 RepID=A0A397T0H2_9GLOM|nr:Ppx/GppA phosphatase family-domain-containing protein [Glomus cerebriforme]